VIEFDSSDTLKITEGLTLQNSTIVCQQRPSYFCDLVFEIEPQATVEMTEQSTIRARQILVKGDQASLSLDNSKIDVSGTSLFAEGTDSYMH